MQFGFQQITFIILLAWFIMFLAGKFQQNRIKKELFERINEGLKPALRKTPELTLDDYYSWVFSNWEELVRRNAWFVLSVNELYPVSADPQRLKETMNLTPIWLGAYLEKNNTTLAMDDNQKTAVERIIRSMPDHQRRE